MLSEFEVPKPNTEFNQIYLDNQEVYIQSLKVRLEITKDLSIQGQLHLTTRSFVFEPKDDKVQLIKMKFCDGLQTKSGKFTLDYVMKELGNKYKNFVKGIIRVLNKKEEKIANQSFHKKITLLVKCNKFVLYERNPPSPFTVEILSSYFTFILESGNYVSYSAPMNDQETLMNNLKQFEKIVNRVKNCEDEDKVIDEIFAERYTKYKNKVKLKKNIEFIYPCWIIQTFENFYGAIYLTDKNKIKIVCLLNKTKDVNFKFSIRDIKWLTLYDYFYKKSAVEIFFFSRSLSYLVNFDTEKRAQKVYKKLKSLAYELIDVQLDSLTKTWTKNLMTNFDYIMYLNRLSNRSFNDITRYPIFPWVISDYSSDEIKINNKYQYRDFEKNIGIINEASKKKSLEYFKYLQNDPLPIKKPFHFHSYISTPGYIIFFYTRMVPSLILKLQSGAFGPTDRIFRSFENLWNSMHSGMTQFTELIPEFYSLNKAHIFLNKYRLDLGINGNGDEIQDVKLARWSNGIEDFMFKMKAALESEHCSLNVHHWIDLVFGSTQRGDKAIQNINIYNESCYKENYEHIGTNNKLKLLALKLQIAEYGQVPNQLFTFDHPKKKIKAQIVMNPISNNMFTNSLNNQETIQLSKEEEEEFNPYSMTQQNSKDILTKLKQLKENFEVSDAHGNDQSQDNNMFFKDNENNDVLDLNELNDQSDFNFD